LGDHAGKKGGNSLGEQIEDEHVAKSSGDDAGKNDQAWEKR
jgi:hypothetical protein